MVVGERFLVIIEIIKTNNVQFIAWSDDTFISIWVSDSLGTLYFRGDLKIIRS